MKLTLVQKVLLSIISIFIVLSAILSFAVATQIKQAYLSEQKRNVAVFVEKQAKQHLTAADFETINPTAILPKFLAYQNEIITQEIIRIKIYNTKGIVLYSDQSELIGQNLFADSPGELEEILQGNVVADIAKQDKKENIYEKQYKQLLEIYTPITFGKSNIAGIVEIYYNLDLLSSEILRSQIYLVISVAVIFTILFGLLFFIVRRASRTIIEQDEKLQEDIKKEQEYSSGKDEFIRLSSHQLRTPATAVRWSVEILADDKTGPLNAEQQNQLESINANSETLVEIINNSLIVAELKADYFTFEKEPYSLSILTSDLLKEKDNLLKTKNITVKMESSDKLAQVNLRQDALKKVVNILIENAINYTPDKGRIIISIEQIDNNLTFKITDTGIGIPESEQNKVFDKIFRASNSIEQKNAGSGLSLYIAKKIIEGYGGKMEFISNKSGSTFSFEVPVFK